MVKQSKLENFSWGEQIEQECRSMAGDYLCVNYSCENSRWKNSHDPSKIKLGDRFIIGVARAEEGSLRFENESHYVAIVECPICFEKFWYHILDTEAEELFNQRKINTLNKFH